MFPWDYADIMQPNSSCAASKEGTNKDPGHANLCAMLTARSEHAGLAFEFSSDKSKEHACSELQAWHDS